MRTLASVVVVTTVLISTACILPTTDQADGASCEKEDECKSHRCSQGSCGGSTCKLGDSSTCSAGWQCVHTDADPITGFFGAKGDDTCHATCGHCPVNTYCGKDGKNDETLCTFGVAPLDLTVDAPRAIVGQPAHFVVTAAAPAGRLVKCTWEFADGSSQEETTAPEVTHVFKEGPYELRINVTCTDDGGRIGSLGTGVEIACASNEASCHS